MKEIKTIHSKGRRKAYLFDDSCAICGYKPVESGRIFHGHCVCEACVEYILKIPGSNPVNIDQEKSA